MTSIDTLLDLLPEEARDNTELAYFLICEALDALREHGEPDATADIVRCIIRNAIDRNLADTL